MMTNWSIEDEVWLRNLLGQPSGQKLIAMLRASIPKIKSLTKEGSWVEAVKKQGHEEMFEKFLALADSELPDYREIQAVDLSKEKD